MPGISTKHNSESGFACIEQDGSDHTRDPSATGQNENQQYCTASAVKHSKRRKKNADYRSQQAHKTKSINS